MKNYDPNIDNGIHTLRVTLQQWDYVGHITQKISGNCKGRNIIDFDFNCVDEFPDNDCNMEFDEDYYSFKCILKNKNGDTLQCVGDAEAMNDMIVCVEILDFEREEES